MTTFCLHRGSLRQAHATEVEIPDTLALEVHLRSCYDTPLDHLETRFYAHDERVGWEKWIVVAGGFGPVGWTNGPMPGLLRTHRTP